LDRRSIVERHARLFDGFQRRLNAARLGVLAVFAHRQVLAEVVDPDQLPRHRLVGRQLLGSFYDGIRFDIPLLIHQSIEPLDERRELLLHVGGAGLPGCGERFWPVLSRQRCGRVALDHLLLRQATKAAR
jgi:hypothetical protein